ncbi:MAG: right-handed parallel beta-helix repeat-containing protein [Putridiphycobacter sp.]|nr:right-handed parallel beta-helix repeat-containing protein [Putridiphycobacter sp.]
MRTLLISMLFTFTLACKKDCLEKGDCQPSAYASSYVEEQNTPAATGITYYVDAENGKKKNGGKSEETAFKEIAQLEGISFQPGDQILFKRDQYHFGDLKIESSGTESAPIYIADYGSGDLPIIKSTRGNDGIALFLLEANYVVIQNLNIQGGGHAILMDGSNNVTIAGCRVGENSEAGIRATGKNSETSGSDKGIIKNCLIYSGLSGSTGDLQGTDGIQLMDGASNWHIHHNEFKSWAHSALSIKPIYSSLESNNNIVEHNLFECGDIDYMRALDITGPENRASNNVVRYNIIRNQTVTSHVHGNDNTIAYNLFLSLKTSAASSQPWAIDFHVFIGNSGGVDRNKYVCKNNRLFNNLFYNYDAGVGVRLLNSKDGTTNKVTDNEIINNIFYNNGTCLEIDAEPTNTTVSNNLFFNSSGSVNFKVNSTSYSISDFTALSGINGFIIENNIEGNPLFQNISSENFRLEVGSPAIDAGQNVGEIKDFAGNPITGNPDIGAFEL